MLIKTGTIASESYRIIPGSRGGIPEKVITRITHFRVHGADNGVAGELARRELSEAEPNVGQWDGDVRKEEHIFPTGARSLAWYRYHEDGRFVHTENGPEYRPYGYWSFFIPAEDSDVRS